MSADPLDKYKGKKPSEWIGEKARSYYGKLETPDMAFFAALLEFLDDHFPSSP